MICPRTDTSSADTGSSATISFGLDGERLGDADALLLTSAELVRPPAEVRRARRQSDLLEEIDHVLLGVTPAADLVQQHDAAQRLVHGLARVE